MGSVYLTQLGQLAEAGVHVERALELLHSPGDDLSNAEIERASSSSPRTLHTRILQDHVDSWRGHFESSQDAAKPAGELLLADPVNWVARQGSHQRGGG